MTCQHFPFHFFYSLACYAVSLLYLCAQEMDMPPYPLLNSGSSFVFLSALFFFSCTRGLSSPAEYQASDWATHRRIMNDNLLLGFPLTRMSDSGQCTLTPA